MNFLVGLSLFYFLASRAIPQRINENAIKLFKLESRRSPSEWFCVLLLALRRSITKLNYSLSLTSIHKFQFVLCLQIKLKKIIGLTVCSSAGLDVSPTTGVIAYPAG